MGQLLPEAQLPLLDAQAEDPSLQTHAYFYQPSDLHLTEKPFTSNYGVDAPPGVARTNISYEKHSVAVYDVRGREESFSLERNGFEIVTHNTSLSDKDLQSIDEVKDRYLEECCNLVKDRLQAAQVVPFGWLYRQSKPGPMTASLGNTPRPLPYLHIDHTVSSLADRLRDHFGSEDGDQILKTSRCSIINAWRPLFEPVEEWPLAYCDTRTVQPPDCIVRDLVKRDGKNEGYILKFNPDQRFYYVSKQRPDEVILFKIAERDPHSPGTFYQGTPHAAVPLPFDDQNPDPKPRTSIEVRMLAIF